MDKIEVEQDFGEINNFQDAVYEYLKYTGCMTAIAAFYVVLISLYDLLFPKKVTVEGKADRPEIKD